VEVLLQERKDISRVQRFETCPVEGIDQGLGERNGSGDLVVYGGRIDPWSDTVEVGKDDVITNKFLLRGPKLWAAGWITEEEVNKV